MPMPCLVHLYPLSLQAAVLHLFQQTLIPEHLEQQQLWQMKTKSIGLDVPLTCIDASVDSKSLHCAIRMCS